MIFKILFTKILALPVYSAETFSEFDAYDPSCRWSNCWDVFNCSSLTVYATPLAHFATKIVGQVCANSTFFGFKFWNYCTNNEFLNWLFSTTIDVIKKYLKRKQTFRRFLRKILFFLVQKIKYLKLHRLNFVSEIFLLRNEGFF